MMNMMMKVFSFFSILILFPIPFHFRYGIFSVLLDDELSYKVKNKASIKDASSSKNYFLILIFFGFDHFLAPTVLTLTKSFF